MNAVNKKTTGVYLRAMSQCLTESRKPFQLSVIERRRQPATGVVRVGVVTEAGNYQWRCGVPCAAL